MSTYLYGLTATAIRDTELAYMAANVDTTLLATCLDRAAGEVNSQVEQHVDSASEITSSAYPSDYAMLRKIVSSGAAAYYGWYKTGSYEGFERFIETFNAGLTTLMEKPNHLKVVRAGLDGVHALHSHASDAAQGDVDAAFSRMVDPLDRDQWEAL